MSAGQEIGGRLLTEPVMPDAQVVRTDCPEGDCAERQPLPASVSATPQERKSPAEWAYQRLILYVQKFEEGLDADHEVGMGFAGSDAGALHIKGMGWFAPDIITFYGVDGSGQRTQLIQHVSQLNVMLKAAPRLHATAERIGFRLREGLDADSERAGGVADASATERIRSNEGATHDGAGNDGTGSDGGD